MCELFERLKSARMELHISQDYIAKYMDRYAIVEIESGKRKVSSEELCKFSELFKISVPRKVDII